MTMSRMTFILGSALIGAASLQLLAPTVNVSPSQPAGDRTAAGRAGFKIAGWGRSDGTAIPDERATIRINQSWRTSWR